MAIRLIPLLVALATFSSSYAEPSSVIEPTSTPSSSTEFSPTPSITPTEVMSSSSEYPSETVMPSPSTSHVMPSTSVAPAPPPELDYKLRKNKTVCIEMTGEVNITVKYKLKNSTKMGTANFLLPKNGKASGTCAIPGKDSTAILTLAFTNMKFGWTFDVKKDNSWTSKSMMLMVTMKGNKLFPNAAKDSITVESGNKSNVVTIKAQAAMSYSCSTSKTYMLGKDVTLNFEKVQVQPFNEEKNKFSKADQCDKTTPSKKTNNIVPIAVGCALAGLIVIVLIAYLIGRRKTSRGYQQV